MSAVDTALVIGAGIAGTACAIGLATAGVAVELVEVKTDVAAVGSGITLQGNALRELRRLGVWDRVQSLGYRVETTTLRAADDHGTVLVELDDMKTGGPDLPAIVGMPRADLARVLLDRAKAAGVVVRTATCATELNDYEDGRGVDVTFSDGSSGRYGLVVGADGVRSWTRGALGIEVETRQIGMAIWRMFGPRPPSVTAGNLYYGGDSLIAGIMPTGEDSLYAYVVEKTQDRSGLSTDQQLEVMRELAGSYHGPWDDVRDTLIDASKVHYTRFETHLLPAPWNRGRVVLIGDAAHSCPPTLAQGGAQALEDAAVLVELVVQADILDQRLWDAFTERRFDRARAVVDASNQLCTWLLDGEQGDVPGLMRSTMALVAEPA